MTFSYTSRGAVAGTGNGSPFKPELTQDDRVDLALDLHGALRTLEHVHRLLELCLRDHNVVVTLVILLKQTHNKMALTLLDTDRFNT